VKDGPYDDKQSYEDETPQVDKTEYANSIKAMFDQPSTPVLKSDSKTK
tara:strand:+ start:262 stop:405 length:144 start_codon:yes stop_codon:yes gene_type:complete